jgi:hypothetical protein
MLSQQIRGLLSRNSSTVQNAINGRRESVIKSSQFDMLIKQIEALVNEEVKKEIDAREKNKERLIQLNRELNS